MTTGLLKGKRMLRKFFNNMLQKYYKIMGWDETGMPRTEKMIGSRDRGILQIFTKPSPYSHEITEYIERFHGFTGFFDKGNVADLMKSTKSFSK